MGLLLTPGSSTYPWAELALPTAKGLELPSHGRVRIPEWGWVTVWRQARGLKGCR